MDLEDPRSFELFLEIYGALPRAGPGSATDTARALGLVPTRDPRVVLDLGCGPGAQTIVLGEVLPEASITAVDILPEMVREAQRRIADAGMAPRVAAVVGDLSAPSAEPGSVDLIWCEGAIYFAGVERALACWRPLLAEGGSVAFTEPIWIHPAPQAELVAWWRSEYSAITDEAGVRAAIDAAGYRTVGSFTLPPESWTDEYYDPMAPRIDEFLAAHRDDPTAAAIATDARHEIATFRANSQYYSYGFFVVEPRSGG